MVAVTPQAPNGTTVDLPELHGISVAAWWKATRTWPVLATRDEALDAINVALAVRGRNAIVETLAAEIAADETAGMVQFED